VGCLWAFARLPEKSPRDLARLVLAFVMTTAFFAADVAIFQPRYLPLFRRSLHPHSPLAVASALTGDKSPYHTFALSFRLSGEQKAQSCDNV
jgi:hypothetical protein